MGRVAPFWFHPACCVIAFAAFANAQQPATASPPETFVLEGRVVDLRGEGAAEPFEVEAGKTHTFDLQLPAK